MTLKRLKDKKIKQTMKTTHIKIVDMHVSDNKLVFKLNISKDISKYFLTDHFVAEYDKKIDDVDKSILSIPVLSTVVTVAWATGADIYIEYLDKTYLDALNRVETLFRRWFPQFSFSTRIDVENIISNKYNTEKYGLVFSGGLDSITTYIRHKEKKPILINIWGADNASPMYKNYELWNKIRTKLLRFANHDGVDIHFIKTNVGELINNKLLTEKFCEFEGDWWVNVSHGLVYTGLSAPITADGTGTLLMASAHTKDYPKPHGSHFFIYVDVGWGCTKIAYDSSDLTRQEKIRCVLRGNPQYYPYLRVCYSQFREHNCGFCEKCLRTITGLILEDIDPQKCNFDIKKGIISLIRGYFSNGLLNIGHSQLLLWQDIQRHIPDNLDKNKLYNSKYFFEWVKEIDLSEYEYRGDRMISRFLKVYYLTKYSPIYSFRHILRYPKRKFKSPKM